MKRAPTSMPTPASTPASRRRRRLRVVALALCLAGLGLSVQRLWFAQHEVQLFYRDLPRGPFQMQVLDAEAHLLRQVYFGPDASHSQTLKLAEGRYTVRLRSGDGPWVAQTIEVTRAGRMELSARPDRAPAR